MLKGNLKSSQPLEIDVRKILEQLGIQKEKWPEEYRNPVSQN
ncbi:hypothetical protein [Cohnella cholangitidis]|nr:hypothetical protein [Cohnella cholangitidis]